MANKKQVTTSLIILIATVLLIIGAVMVTKNDKESETQSTANSQPTQKTNSSKNSSSYKEGTYTAIGDYQSPGGQEKIKITITISKDGTVSSTDADAKAISSDGARFQQKFISGYKSKVVGKNIDDINLDQVSGSSLTPIGFNDAISKIQDQAQA